MAICGNCGASNPDRAKFCLECGTPVVPEPEPRAARKTVTVLFSDLSGSTAMGERLEAESLQEVLRKYFEQMRAVIEAHGGTVAKFIGDAIMAVFGVPTVHEDDALRAVRAAVEMRQRLAALNEELDDAWGIRLGVRTGVNTGEIVDHGEAPGSSLALGDPVNTAARLEQAAVAGEVLVSEATWRLVRDAVVSEPVEPVSAKGKAEPLRAHRLLDVRAHEPGRARRLDVPLVRRESELEALRDAFSQTVGRSACRLVTIVGPAGIGKSRLIGAFLGEVEGRARVLGGRCLAYGQGITFWPIGEVVRQAAGISEGTGIAEAQRKIEELCTGAHEGEAVAARIAELIGLATPQAGIDEAFWAMRKLLEALAAEHPLVLVLDDIHWGEPALFDLLDHVVTVAAAVPLFIICIARPEIEEVRPGWIEGAFTSVFLEPLPIDAAQEVISNLLGAGLPEPLQGRLLSAAQGNPLFVEEMVGMLIDDGQLVRRNDGTWVPTEDLTAVAVPPTIGALLSARLDRLLRSERIVIEGASVVGQEFDAAAVAAVSPSPVNSEVLHRLGELERRQLVRRDGASAGGADAYRFVHLLIRDAAYLAMAKSVRAELHERFARWLDSSGGDRRSEYRAVIGYHLEQAYRYLTELRPSQEPTTVLGEEAAAHLASAAARARQHGDNFACLNLLERAAGLIGDGSSTRADLLLALGRCLLVAGRFGEARERLLDACRSASLSHRDNVEMSAQIALASLALLEAKEAPEDWIARASALVRRSIPMFEELGDHDGLVRAYDLLGEVGWMKGSATESLLAARRARTHADACGNVVERDRSTIHVLNAALEGPTPASEALTMCDEAYARAAGRIMPEAQILSIQAPLLAMRGDLIAARQTAIESIARFRDLGLAFNAAMAETAAGEAEMLDGDPGLAELHLRRSSAELRSMGEDVYRSTTVAELASVVFESGRHEEALELVALADSLTAPEDVVSRTLATRVRGRVLAATGHTEAALTLTASAVEESANTDMFRLRGGSLLDHASCMRIAGNLGEALSLATEAFRIFNEKENVVMARRAGRLVEQLVEKQPSDG